MLLGPLAVAGWEDGAVGSSRWSLRAMVTADQCSKGARNSMVTGARVTWRPVSEFLCQWGSMQRLEIAQHCYPGAASRVPVFCIVSVGVSSGLSGLTA